MDYRALLIKYISHIYDCEGIAFLGDECFNGVSPEYPGPFTPEEAAELLLLAKQA